MINEKSFLDQAGVQYLWSKLSLEDYPNNEMLIAVINAIDSGKQDKTTTEVVNLTTDNWTLGLDNRYYQTVEVETIHANTPVVIADCKLDGVNLSTDLKVLEAWQLVSINNVTQEEGKLTFYSYSNPEIDIPVILGVV